MTAGCLSLKTEATFSCPQQVSHSLSESMIGEHVLMGQLGMGPGGTREVLGSARDNHHWRFYVLRAKNFKGPYRTID